MCLADHKKVEEKRTLRLVESGTRFFWGISPFDSQDESSSAKEVRPRIERFYVLVDENTLKNTGVEFVYHVSDAAVSDQLRQRRLRIKQLFETSERGRFLDVFVFQG